MEFKMQDLAIPEKIGFNFEELKTELAEKMTVYKGLTYTEEQVKEAKVDRATLNKLVKAIEDKRKEIKSNYMQPYTEFEAKCKEITALINEPIKLIDTQIKDFEEKQKIEKLEECKEAFANVGFPEFIKFEQLFDSKWLNKTASIKSIQDELTEKKNTIESNMQMLSNLPEFGFEACEVYKTTLDVNKAVNEAQRMSQIAKAKAEAEEKRRQEEQARKEAEFMNPPITDDNIEGQTSFCNLQEFDRIVEEAKATPKKQWVAFQALMSTDDALALKNFFNSRNIEFRKGDK